MRAWVVAEPGPVAGHPLEWTELADPVPGPGQVRLRVEACGVCRTDLHLAEGDLAPRRPRTVPGHEVVGRVDAVGPSSERFVVGDRVGVAWLRGTCGRCRWCRSGRENLCPRATFTGWDADGGFAELAIVDESFAYRLPGDVPATAAAPLLCSGIVGYRALKRATLPPGGRLGLYGFGASAHLVAQVAVRQGATVHVMTRSPAAQRLALELGAASASGADAEPPEPLDAAVVFAPVGTLVPPALRALDRGGVCVVAGIHLTDVPALDYERELFYERELRSVTASTRADGDEFLRLAAALDVRPATTVRPLAAAADTLADLAADAYEGAAVLVP
ncbi:zinc-dependent alcohol dehydrogenase family protein [Georgenia sp. EYE_87]|uniref:zinc-dependent alcohol dehydrogenase family protein n=1 Tax=Georgenia sp. EYE_87 TaxID=2853448 RepID=UPI0020041514|nr:zinc-dependent alcohol dehydrogenase family protein [Georgenia sp. EYE_87]MCK6209588.1 zinc-dependent alcohol dehydrogenase family protein [Georgenia sp. EYE_87]